MVSAQYFYRCEQGTGDACSFFRSPTNYYMTITNETLLIVNYLIATAGNLNTKCNNFFSFSLCFYLFRSCEVRNVSDPSSGSQLTICKNKCAGLNELFQECSNQMKLQVALGNSQNKALQNLVLGAERFICSDPETYIIPEVPVSNRLCDDIDYIDNLLKSEGKQS